MSADRQSGTAGGNESLRILWLSPYFPAPLSGAGTRVYYLLKGLAESCEIDLISGEPAGDLPEGFKHAVFDACRSVQLVPPTVHSRRHKRYLQLRSLVSRHPAQYWMFYSSRMQSCIDEAVAMHEYDLVILEHSFMGYYARSRSIASVLDQHNVESEILLRSGARERSPLRRAYNRLEYLRYRSDERRVCAAADLILAASGRDREEMLSWGGMPTCLVIANGVDTTYFAPVEERGGEAHGPSVVFTGTMNYSPNIEAVLFFASQIWPDVVARVPSATLEIVGQSPPPEVLALRRNPGINVTGFVPDVRPYLAGAGAVVAPLRIGGGTRLKILEAMAMGKPVVSTTLGCEGIEVQNGRHLMIADDAGDFADRVVGVLNDQEGYRRMGQEGRRLVEEQYDWGALSKRMEEGIRALLKYRTSQRADPQGTLGEV